MNLLNCSKQDYFLKNPGTILRGLLTSQISKAMKLTVILLTIAFAQVSARGFSQNVTLTLKDAPAETMFKEIERQTGMGFLYTKKMLQDAPKVNLSVKNMPVSEVLKKYFIGQNLDFAIQNNTIVITKKSPTAPVVNNTPAKPEPPVITITGRVTDDKGNPVQSVSVVIPGTPLGAMTNENGEYSISNAPERAKLIFSYVGYETQNIDINNRTIINVVLRVVTKAIDEVMVIGYGTTSKRKNTGSVSSISAEEITKQPVGNPLNALQGRIAGATVIQQNGLPGSRVNILIRGQNSLSNGTQPLFIIDGVPFNQQDQAVPASNDINSFGIFAANRGVSPFSIINPNDIERIDVLKDADATAIYGTRAANGVVLITTKKGKSGKTKLDVNVYTGAGRVAKFVEMMDLKQYLQMRREAFANDAITPTTANAPDLLVWDTTQSTNWLEKYLGGTANTLDAQATISGGDSRTRFLFNTGFHRETTVFPGDFDDSRISARFNADHSSQDRKFNISLTSSYSVGRTNLLGTDLASAVFNLPPNMPLYKNDGTLFWNANFTNPESYALAKYVGKTNNFLSNLQLRYTILPGLDIKTNFGFTKITLDQNQQNPVSSKNPLTAALTNSARFANIDQESYIIEPQATYTKVIGKGKLSTLLGTTFQRSLNKSLSITADNYSNPGLLSTVSGAGIVTNAATYTLYKYNSLFGRINYDLLSKYIFNVNFRRDGSSKFGANNRFGNFGSIGAAWVFTEEKFIKNVSWISFGKLRASYGITGSDQLQDYQYITLFTASSGNSAYQGSNVLSPSRVNNPDIKWETNKKLEFGLDLGFLKDMILLTANYYRNRSDNQLGFLRLASQAGFNAYTSNFDALIQNSGTEFELNTINFKTKEFEWKTSFNLTVPSTKLLEASNQYFFFNQQLLGQPLSVVFRYTYLGVDPATGRPQYLDQTTKQPTLTPNFNTDRLPVGFTAPKFYGGINNNLSYKNFELSFFFQFTKQEGNIVQSATPGTFSNQNVYWLNRWRNPGDANVLPKASITTAVYSNFGTSDAIWGDASFARLRNMNISYGLPEKVLSKLKLSQCRIYMQGQNLATWTNNKYVSDPETISTINQSSVVMPPLRVFTFGINVSL